MAELLSDLCFALCVRYLLATQVSAFDRWMMRHESLVLQDECTEKGELLFQRRECRGVLWQWRGRYQRIREDEGRFLRAHGHWVKRLKTGSCCVWRKLTRDGKQFKQRLGSLGLRMVHRESHLVVEHWRERAEAMLEQAEMQEDGVKWYVKRRLSKAWGNWKQWFAAVTLSHLPMHNPFGVYLTNFALMSRSGT